MPLSRPFLGQALASILPASGFLWTLLVMTAEAIMTRNPVTSAPDTRLEDALALMRQHHLHNLPVVGADGKLLGVLGLSGLTRALLPVAAQLIGAGLLDLSYLPENLGELRERLEGLRGLKVADFLPSKDEMVVCKPDASVHELIYLMSHSSSRPGIVLVTGDAGELLGVVTDWDILNKLALRFLEDPTGTGAGQR
jgi:CBS domain-containing protein